MDSQFRTANKKVHKVEDQWHYLIMKKHGWTPDILIGIGFVRSYNYSNSNIPNKITVTTGSHADYWTDTTIKNVGGYWSTLEVYLKSLK